MTISLKIPQLSSAEKELTADLQQQAWLNSFANKLLADNLIQDINDELKANKADGKTVDFSKYSGVQPQEKNNYLGKFFVIARYVDEVKKGEYMTGIKDSDPNSPLALKDKTQPFDTKPWDPRLVFKDLPDYIKNHIFQYRMDILKEQQKVPFPFPSFSRNDSEADFFATLESYFNKLDQNDRAKLLGASALQGTSSPIIQNQVGNRLYIQGYLMNIVNTTEYSTLALNNGYGLLSGPSGTAFRVKKYVQENSQKLNLGKWNEKLQLQTASLCLAALGYPYNCHSYYEIMTVVFPNKFELPMTIEEFRNKLTLNKLL